ncbi:MAG: DUF2236 domain-containing protein [Acidobacteria bacterium]|nr:DUF2236 domain-containing protein [Acidobacteriota bacterium]
MSTDKWTDEFLASMRQEMDPPADEVIRRLFDEGGLAGLRQFHSHILRNDGIPLDGLPPYVVDYLLETAEPPAWMDRDAVRMAEEVLSSYGLIAFTVLAGASLPECYVDRPGVPALWLTQKINAHVYRRVVETSQFVMGVMVPGGLERGGKGIQAAQKVRLMHASVRHLMLQTPDEQLAKGTTSDIADVFRSHTWREELGLPINQEDLAYTLQTFAWVGVRGMRDLECGLTRDQEEAVIQVWNATGHTLGIREDLMPADVAEAQLLFERIKARIAAPSEEGASLQAALLNYQESLIPEFMGNYRHLPRMIMRHLVGDDTANMLGVPPLMPVEVEEAHEGIALIEGLDHVEDHVFHGFSPVRKGAEWLFRRMLETYARLPAAWERDLFTIPEGLATEWSIARLKH